jgi:hypothetical protein
MNRLIVGLLAIAAVCVAVMLGAFTAKAATTTAFCVDSNTITLTQPQRSDFPSGGAGNVQFLIASAIYNAEVASYQYVVSHGGTYTSGGVTHTVTSGPCYVAPIVAPDSTVFLDYPGIGTDDPASYLSKQAATLVSKYGYTDPVASKVKSKTYIGNGWYLHSRVPSGETLNGGVVNSMGLSEDKVNLGWFWEGYYQTSS